PPCPSTSALVASVVDIDTSRMLAAGTAAFSSTRSTAPEMPSARSWRVVSDFALASTSPRGPADSSQSTASVYVPPVSMPRKRLEEDLSEADMCSALAEGAHQSICHLRPKSVRDAAWN